MKQQKMMVWSFFDAIYAETNKMIHRDNLPLEYAMKIKNSTSMNLQQEYKKVDKNGKIHWLKSSVMPIYEDDVQIGEIIVNYDITDKKILQKLAITDGLTNLYNRRYFNEIINREIARAARKRSMLSFLILDIDFFKQYNDTYGHDAGDNVLIRVSNSIVNSIHRGGDFAFRLGGEEFGIIFCDCDKEQSLVFADSIIENIQKLNIPHSKSIASRIITASAGLLTIDFRDEYVDKDGFYTMADDALYQAKEKGRNKVILYKNDDLEFF